MRGWALAAGLLLAAGPSSGAVTLLDFADLPGWAEDDHEAALAAFRVTCGDLDGADWAALCALSAALGPGDGGPSHRGGARGFFEAYFRPVLIEDGAPALVTGYFEPELPASLAPDDRFRVPLYALPPEAPEGKPWHTRAEIERGALAGRGLEIAWLDDPVDLFFLQVQGSGRLRLPDGTLLRVGYAGHNGHPYTSVGGALVARGALPEHGLSAPAIRAWVRENPGRGRALLRLNASWVFFRDRSEVPPEAGPVGAMGRSVTAGRSIAVDPAHVPLGAPVWLETAGLRRLMVAQDTGSAIKGAQRADVFVGTGPEAGERAGTMRDAGRLVILLPRARASVLAGAARAEAPPSPPSRPLLSAARPRERPPGGDNRRAALP